MWKFHLISSFDICRMCFKISLIYTTKIITLTVISASKWSDRASNLQQSHGKSGWTKYYTASNNGINKLTVTEAAFYTLKTLLRRYCLQIHPK